MVKLSQELKIEIFEKSKYLKHQDIMQEYKISKASFYRTMNEFKNNQSQKSYKSILSKKSDISQNINDIESDNNSDQEVIIKNLETQEINETLNETKETINKNNETKNNNNEEVNKSFDKNNFIKQLNNSLSSSSSLQEEIKDNFKEELPKYNNNNNTNNKSILSSISTTKKFNNNNNIYEKSNILDVIKNVNNENEDIETLKRKRNLIIVIKQYLNNFSKELINIYGGNKNQFDKKLYTLNISQLEIILENCRIELSVFRNKQNFSDCVEFGLRSVENISSYTGYDVSGVSDELMNDESFKFDLKVLASEIDISKYLNPKNAVALKIIKGFYMQYKKNKVKKQLNDLFKDKNKEQLIKDLDKNKK